MSLDLVIRNGTVVDGTGLASYRADVGVRQGRIVAIGRIPERGRRELDADGHVVTPGFIDGHTHMDAQVFWDPLGTCSCWHGVTTVVMGHCGFTLAPAKFADRALVIRNLERAEDISGAAIAAGIDWTWSNFAQYMDAVDAVPKGINYATNIGHSALRTWAMGERAFDGPSSDTDIDVMVRELRAALQAGAIGFTTSRSGQHETSDNRPVASRLATWSEVRRLVNAMGELGTGMFELANEPAANGEDNAARDEYYGRLRALAVESGVPMVFGTLGRHARSQLALLDSTAAAGGRMFGMTHSRGVSVVLSFRTHLPFDGLAEWKPVRALPLDQQKKALADPATRKRLLHAAHHGDYGNPIGAEARKPDYTTMRILDTPLPPHRTVAEVAAERGVDPVDLIIDLSLASDFAQFFVQPITPMDPKEQLVLMKHPRTVMTFSDAGAHVSQIMDSSIQTHLLAHWVRDQQAFTLEEAVRMLTLAPARAWGFANRGLVREGLVADLNVFDPATVGPDMPTVASDLPSGALRLRQEASGFLATIVGGEIVLDRGRDTGARPGRLVRGPLHVRA